MVGEDHYGIRNVSQDTWNATTPSGRVRLVQPNEVVPVKEGIRLNILNTELQIQKSEKV